MLVAELARVWKLVGGERGVTRDAGEDAGATDRKDAGDALLRPRNEGTTTEVVSSRFDDDMGEAVEREPDLEAPSVDAGAGATLSEPSTETTTTRPKSPLKATKRQRQPIAKGRKGSSVIDDLFRGLD